MTYIFDRETALTAVDSENFVCELGTAYLNPTGAAFGGWVAGIAVEAISKRGDSTCPVVSMQMSFLSGVIAGTVNVETHLLKAGSSTKFWRAEIRQNNILVATADLICSNRRQTDINYQIVMPDAPAPHQSVLLSPMPPTTPNWIASYDQFLVKGKPFSVNETPETLMWIKESDGRPVDRKSIVAICDTPMPRSFFVSDGLRMGSTAQMATFILASDEELHQTGSDYMLLRASGASVRNSVIDQRVELWSKNGTILATSNQITFFR